MVQQNQMLVFMAVVIGIVRMTQADEIRSVQGSPIEQPNKFYVSNRAPLRTSPFVKLPIGSIVPRAIAFWPRPRQS